MKPTNTNVSWPLEATVHVKFHENPLTGSSVILGTYEGGPKNNRNLFLLFFVLYFY
jgi:hypothetical protein